MNDIQPSLTVLGVTFHLTLVQVNQAHVCPAASNHPLKYV